MFETLLKSYKKILYLLTIGYSLSTKMLNDLLCHLNSQKILYGVISINDINDIDENLIQQTKLIEIPAISSVININVTAEDFLIVLVPTLYSFNVTKNNIPFDTSLLGCNGEKILNLNGDRYRVFGEFILNSENVNIYIK